METKTGYSYTVYVYDEKGLIVMLPAYSERHANQLAARHRLYGYRCDVKRHEATA